jgi:iron complex transport system ATP-binding protein
VIRARGARVRIGGRVLLDDVTLAVHPGELLAIVGPNGAGKSTLLGALAGDRPLSAGSIELDGRDLGGYSLAELARRRAVLPQEAGLVAPLTALEVVMLGQHAGAPLERARRAHHRLAELELDGFDARRYSTLSGGERQRVHLARVLEQLGERPGLLLLDEPTAALDLKHQHLVLDRARAAAGAGHAVVVVLHDLTLAARHADRIALLDRGRLVAHGGPAEVLLPERLATVFDVAIAVLPSPDGRGLAVLALHRSSGAEPQSGLDLGPTRG